MRSIQTSPGRAAGTILAHTFFYILVITSFVSLVYRIGGYPIYPSYPALFACIILAVLHITNRKKINIPGFSDMVIATLGMLPFFLSIFARSPEEARESSFVFIYFAATFFTVKYLLNRKIIAISSIISGFSVVFFSMLFIGVLQALTGSPIGLIANYFGSSSSEGALYQGSFRVSGTLASPNVFANCLVFLMPAGVHYIFKHLKIREAYVIALCVIILSFLLVIGSGSRAGVLYLCISLLAGYAIWLRQCRTVKNRSITIVLLGIVFISSIFIVYSMRLDSPSLVVRVLETGDSGRLSTYRRALSIIQEPRTLLIGVGSGQFFEALYDRNMEIEYRSWMDPQDIPSTVHNWVLQVVSEMGIITFSAWLFFIVFVYRRAVYVFSQDRNIVFFLFGINFVSLFLVPLQFDTSVSNPSVLTIIALAGAMIIYRSESLARWAEPTVLGK